MEFTIQGAPAFGFMHVDLEPGDKIITESDAMASMNSEIDMKPRLNGGLIKGLIRKFLGGESLFINEFSNNTSNRHCSFRKWWWCFIFCSSNASSADYG